MTSYNEPPRDISRKYCPRFGEIAVERGYITDAQLQRALRTQRDDECAGRAHRFLGVILFDQDWMTSEQIEDVLTRLFRRMRDAREIDEVAPGHAAPRRTGAR